MVMNKFLLILSAITFLTFSVFAGYDCNSCQGGLSKAKSERFEKFRNLSPEERKALKEKYSSLTPEERKALRQERLEKFKSKQTDQS